MKPSERPTKHRDAVRLLIVADDWVLLQNDHDPGVPGSGWWVPPGGGIEAGEGPRDAAIREAWEETGLRLAPEQLVGPVGERVVRHGYSDRILVQRETFFRVDVERFDPRPQQLTENEKIRKLGERWWPTAQLPQPVWPARIDEYLRWAGGPAVDLGFVDESTID